MSQCSTSAAHRGRLHTVTMEPAQGILTETLIGSFRSATSPGPVLVEGLAALAVGASRVVLAHADQPPSLVRRALAGVAVAFAPAARPQHADKPL